MEDVKTSATSSMDTLMKSLSSPRTWIIIVVGIVISMAGYWVYQTYVAPRLSASYVENKEFIHKTEEAQDTQDAEVMLFYTTWCPHCKKVKPIWNDVKSQFHERELHGKRILFSEIDCEKDSDIADKFNIAGYPTIKMIVSGNVIEYDAKPDHDTLVEFIQSQSAM